MNLLSQPHFNGWLAWYLSWILTTSLIHLKTAPAVYTHPLRRTAWHIFSLSGASSTWSLKTIFWQCKGGADISRWVSVSPTLVHSMSSFVCTICGTLQTAQLVRYCVLLLPACVPSCPFCLLHWTSGRLCPAMRPHLSDAGRGRRKGRPLRFGLKESSDALLHCTAYTLLPHWCSHHSILHPPCY